VYWTVADVGAGCVLAARGIVLGVVQFRSRGRSFIRVDSIPRWMRWHYLFAPCSACSR